MQASKVTFLYTSLLCPSVSYSQSSVFFLKKVVHFFVVCINNQNRRTVSWKQPYRVSALRILDANIHRPPITCTCSQHAHQLGMRVVASSRTSRTAHTLGREASTTNDQLPIDVLQQLMQGFALRNICFLFLTANFLPLHRLFRPTQKPRASLQQLVFWTTTNAKSLRSLLVGVLQMLVRGISTFRQASKSGYLTTVADLHEQADKVKVKNELIKRHKTKRV